LSILGRGFNSRNDDEGTLGNASLDKDEGEEMDAIIDLCNKSSH